MVVAQNNKYKKPWAEGPEALVFAYDDFESDFAAIKEPSRSKIEATIREQYVQFGPQSIKNKEKMNKDEGRHNVGGVAVLVQTFKHYQARVYGAEGSHNQKRAFFISAVDPGKKRNRANQQLLKRAAEGALKLANSIPLAKIGKSR